MTEYPIDIKNEDLTEILDFCLQNNIFHSLIYDFPTWQRHILQFPNQNIKNLFFLLFDGMILDNH